MPGLAYATSHVIRVSAFRNPTNFAWRIRNPGMWNPEFSSTNTGFCLMIGILNSSFTDKESIIDYLIPESKSVLDNLTDGTRYSKYVPHSTVIYIQDTDQFVIHGHCLVSVLYVLYRLYSTNARLWPSFISDTYPKDQNFNSYSGYWNWEPFVSDRLANLSILIGCLREAIV